MLSWQDRPGSRPSTGRPRGGTSPVRRHDDGMRLRYRGLDASGSTVHGTATVPMESFGDLDDVAAARDLLAQETGLTDVFLLHVESTQD